MNSDPLVSVVMPVYNVGHVVAEAIDSVLGQTLAEFELIIVDDASTDDTPQVLAYYLAQDSRVRLTRNPTNSRHGNIQWEPRNNGLQIARGEYIAYLDGDNTWEPSMLATLADLLLNRGDLQLAYCRSRNFHHPDEIDTVIAADGRPVVERDTDSVVFAHDVLRPAELGRSQYVDTNEIMHRASVFTMLGSLWNTAHPRRAWINQQQGRRCPYRRHNDLDLVERIIRAFGAEAVAQLPRVLVNFFYPSAPGRTGPQAVVPIAEGVAS